MIVWKYILHPSILDHFRDKLFDLRDNVRDYYLTNDIALDDKTYKSIRDLINSHLRFTERMSLIKVLCFSSLVDNNKELKNYIKNELDSKFNTNNKELLKFIKETRDKSSLILIDYMVFSSPFLISLFMLISFCFVPILLVKWLLSSIKNELNLIKEAMQVASKVIIKFVATKDDLEEISYETENQVANMA